MEPRLRSERLILLLLLLVLAGCGNRLQSGTSAATRPGPSLLSIQEYRAAFDVERRAVLRERYEHLSPNDDCLWPKTSMTRENLLEIGSRLDKRFGLATDPNLFPAYPTDGRMIADGVLLGYDLKSVTYHLCFEATKRRERVDDSAELKEVNVRLLGPSAANSAKPLFSEDQGGALDPRQLDSHLRDLSRLYRIRLDRERFVQLHPLSLDTLVLELRRQLMTQRGI